MALAELPIPLNRRTKGRKTIISRVVESYVDLAQQPDVWEQAATESTLQNMRQVFAYSHSFEFAVTQPFPDGPSSGDSGNHGSGYFGIWL